MQVLENRKGDTNRRAGIVVTDGKLLLCCQPTNMKRNGWKLDLPKGHIRQGESPLEAAVRECLEETGIRFEPWKLTNPIQIICDGSPLFLFLAKIDKIIPVKLLSCASMFTDKADGVRKPEVEAYAWIDPRTRLCLVQDRLRVGIHHYFTKILKEGCDEDCQIAGPMLGSLPQNVVGTLSLGYKSGKKISRHFSQNPLDLFQEKWNYFNSTLEGNYMDNLEEKHQHLNEKLEPATERQFDLLQKQIDSDPETARMLTSPMEDIPQYKWLYYELYDDLERMNGIIVKKMSLYAVMSILGKLLNLEFSKSGNLFTGFLSYKENGKEITAIKMASFKDDSKSPNPVLAADLFGFLDREIKKRTLISWLVHKANKKAAAQYDKLLDGKNFIWSKSESKNGGLWLYTVTGKQK